MVLRAVFVRQFIYFCSFISMFAARSISLAKCCAKRFISSIGAIASKCAIAHDRFDERQFMILDIEMSARLTLNELA